MISKEADSQSSAEWVSICMFNRPLYVPLGFWQRSNQEKCTKMTFAKFISPWYNGPLLWFSCSRNICYIF